MAADLHPARALVLETEIACRDALVAGDILRRSGQNEFAEFHDIGVVSDLQGRSCVLLDQWRRDWRVRLRGEFLLQFAKQ